MKTTSMARNGFRILDCDLHVMEPPDLWQRYTDDKFKHLAPIGVGSWRDVRMKHPDGTSWGRPDIGSEALREGTAVAKGSARYQPYGDRGWSAESQVDAMDAEGIDVAVLVSVARLGYPCRAEYEPAPCGGPGPRIQQLALRFLSN